MPKRSLVAAPEQHSIVATTVFNAPRPLVFRLMTDPEAIPQWWGPASLTTTVDKMEPWAGGSWRFVVSDGKGKQWPFHGVYHTVEAAERTVFTLEFENEPGKVSLETNIYEDHDGGTKVTTISVFQSVADRDVMFGSDMMDGDAEAMDNLERLLATMAVAR